MKRCSARLSDSAMAARQQLGAGRQRIRELHDRGLDGPQGCARLTSLVDTVVLQLFEACLAELDAPELGTSKLGTSELGTSGPADANQPSSASNRLRSQIALVGHGGYGRRQSSPFSDVDLMILHEGRATDEIVELARRMTQGIFDAGLQLGQSVRSVHEAVQLARTDSIVCTSLIDARLLVGTQSLFDTFRTNFKNLVRKRSKPLAHAFLEAREKERHQYGEAE